MLEAIKNILKRFRTAAIFIISIITFNILILSDKNNSIDDRLYSFSKLILLSAPVAFIMDIIGGWFTDNSEFSTYVIACILINMVIGGIRHRKTFSWIQLLIKTGLMFLVLVAVYAGLEMMLKIARDNIITELFRIALQISTLMYPLSKAFKNIFILTNGEHPPAWVMKRFYKFHKDGDLEALFKNKEDENLN